MAIYCSQVWDTISARPTHLTEYLKAQLGLDFLHTDPDTLNWLLAKII
mgnify:CR=1|jgi:hypothetical protein